MQTLAGDKLLQTLEPKERPRVEIFLKEKDAVFSSRCDFCKCEDEYRGHQSLKSKFAK